MSNLSKSDVKARDEVVKLIQSGRTFKSSLSTVISRCNDGGRRAHLWAVLPRAVSKKIAQKKVRASTHVRLDRPLNSSTVVTPRMLQEARAVAEAYEGL